MLATTSKALYTEVILGILKKPGLSMPTFKYALGQYYTGRNVIFYLREHGKAGILVNIRMPGSLHIPGTQLLIGLRFAAKFS